MSPVFGQVVVFGADAFFDYFPVTQPQRGPSDEHPPNSSGTFSLLGRDPLESSLQHAEPEPE